MYKGGCLKCGKGLTKPFKTRGYEGAGMTLLEDKTFNDSDIRNLTGSNNIVSYHNLGRYYNVDELLDHNGVVIILYETSYNVGHWTTLFKINNNTLEFFDSLGFKVDEELNEVPKNMRPVLNEMKPHLSYILDRSPYKVIQNTYPLQEYKHHINTCGRWVSARLVLRDVPLSKFIQKFTAELPERKPDELVVEFTENLLRN